jgi:hypothetical protein
MQLGIKKDTLFSIRDSREQGRHSVLVLKPGHCFDSNSCTKAATDCKYIDKI